MTRVKICGITNLDDARLAVDAGADAVGFIFVENTPRFVTPDVVAPIVRVLPPFVTAVGVFWDHSRAHIKAIAETCRLGALQFHGAEMPEDLSGYEIPVIKTVKLAPPAEGEAQSWYRTYTGPNLEITQFLVGRVSAVLLDSASRWSEGEPRQPIAWQIARQYVARGRIILSAGLTPDNVARAVAIARPYAVDVNSGVEAEPGRKDPDKVWRFVAEAKRA
jgi:phosphoribosylanthranilate isomerase